ncbi:MAG TPA: tetratricopeptide repeat protein [Steroidobacteraceae bacterium]|nr:tetratricopeptide repeat protein [Steroidobacteraceae bacterium]
MTPNGSLRLGLGALALTFVATAAQALTIDYNPARAEELRACDDQAYRGKNDEAQDCFTDVFSNARNNTLRGLAAWSLGDLSAANTLFRAATQRDPNSVFTRIAWGRLFVATHQDDEAIKLFREALTSDPNNAQAKLGTAQIYVQRFEGAARGIVTDVLKQDDSLIEAHLLLARMNLEEGKLEESEKNLDRAMTLTEKQKFPPLEIFALRASLDVVRGNDGERWIKRALEYNPQYGGVYLAIAHHQVMRRRYSEAVTLLRKAIELEPKLADAQAELGSNLLRLGQIEEGQKHLALAYEADPYSVTTVNTLRLLDRFPEFENTTTDAGVAKLELRLHKKEAAILRPYVESLAKSSVETFSRRYKFEPKQPITIEFYPNHDDFAVRVGGLPGIGLLGVTFGYLLAMDSPSGRATGDFHWGSTLWHEMAHVFTLAATDHRVPRWLSEGISVFEEWRTGPTPGVAVPFEVLAAFQEGKFLKVDELDSGFIRPSYQNQVQVSYMQAGLTCLYIEERFGFDKLVALLDQYKRDVSVTAAVKGSLNVSTSDFDKGFNEWVKQRYSKILPNIDSWKTQYTKSIEAAEKEDWEAVVEPASAVVEMYAEVVDSGSPFLLLAKAYEKTDKQDLALQTLIRYRAAGGWEPDALRKLAKELLARKRDAEALDVMNAINYGDPLNSESHMQLADALLAAKRPQDAAREYRAMLALDTHDKATAYLGVARALRTMGDRPGSRRNVLEALEAAPHYKPAQELLLEIVEGRE